MKKNYMTRGILLLGAVALSTSAFAAEEETGTWVDVTRQYIKDAVYMPGWQGVITGSGEGVAEVFNGAFRAYQNLGEMPAGEYTLTANALYRCGNNNFAKENMAGKDELHTAYIFINDAKTPVKGLFEEGVDPAPDNLAQANAAFEGGKFVNTVKYNHEGGELVIGIANTGCYHEEWCAFDNFKLVGPEGEVAIENGDFATGLDAKRAWNCVNAKSDEKTPDMQKDGAGGGDYRKCGGSPYKFGQQVELPAGKYRFGMLCFHRYGSEVDAAGNYYNHKWPCLNLNDKGEPVEAYGAANRTPKDWFEAGDYDTNTDYAHAYIFVSMGADCPKDLSWSEDFGDLDEDQDLRVRVKDVWEIHNGDLDAMPHNNPVRVAGNDKPATFDEWNDVIPYETKNKVIYRHDSGDEREAAAAFVNDPEKYYQFVEFELSEPAKVWIGMGKNANSSDGYWHAWADQTLKKYDATTSGVSDILVEDADAPIEYYNLQGVRVAEPENGIFIRRQGNKATKVVK